MSRESRRRKELARQERRRGERERERELQHVATVTSQRPMPVAALQQAPTRRRRFGTWWSEGKEEEKEEKEEKEEREQEKKGLSFCVGIIQKFQNQQAISVLICCCNKDSDV